MEILFTRSSEHLGKVKKAYKDLFQNELEEDLDKENKLHDRLLLKFLIDCKRDENAKADPEEAEQVRGSSLCVTSGNFGPLRKAPPIQQFIASIAS